MADTKLFIRLTEVRKRTKKDAGREEPQIEVFDCPLTVNTDFIAHFHPFEMTVEEVVIIGAGSNVVEVTALVQHNGSPLFVKETVEEINTLLRALGIKIA